MTENIIEKSEEKLNLDQLCKRLIKEFFRDFLDFFFPEFVKIIDFTSVCFIDKELYSGEIEGEETRSDILAIVKLLDGSEEIILTHIEVQGEKDLDFSKRMFNYFVDIWREHEKRVFAFALFIDETVKWRPPVSDVFSLEFMGTEVRYKYHLRKTKDYNYRDYLDHENPITVALMTRMNYGKDSRALVKAEALKKMKKYNLTPLQQAILINFIEKLLFLNEKEEKEFKEIVKKEEYKGVTEMITTWEAKGIKKGREEGIEEGKKEKSIEIAKNLLNIGIEKEKIAEVTGLTVDEVKKLAGSG